MSELTSDRVPGKDGEVIHMARAFGRSLGLIERDGGGGQSRQFARKEPPQMSLPSLLQVHPKHIPQLQIFGPSVRAGACLFSFLPSAISLKHNSGSHARPSNCICTNANYHPSSIASTSPFVSLNPLPPSATFIPHHSTQ
ncbi:hypothetical protein CBL_04290 [Carabus blaptoides fortunei]